LVTIDYFTNWVEAEPIKNQTVDECVRAFFKSVISRHGSPREVMSDSGTQFLSGDFQKFCRNFKIKQRESAPYLHQTNHNPY
jgi:transposase InsO family protein